MHPRQGDWIGACQSSPASLHCWNVLGSNCTPGCSLTVDRASGCQREILRSWKARHPDAVVHIGKELRGRRINLTHEMFEEYIKRGSTQYGMTEHAAAERLNNAVRRRLIRPTLSAEPPPTAAPSLAPGTICSHTAALRARVCGQIDTTLGARSTTEPAEVVSVSEEVTFDGEPYIEEGDEDHEDDEDEEDEEGEDQDQDQDQEAGAANDDEEETGADTRVGDGGKRQKNA